MASMYRPNCNCAHCAGMRQWFGENVSPAAYTPVYTAPVRKQQASQINFYGVVKAGPFDYHVIDTRTGRCSERLRSRQEAVIRRASLAVRNMMEDSAGTDKADRVSFA